jgi:predicted component of type VI protein secretion system
VARYRLRFLLQEFDLPRGATLIGRSSDCHVTIEDPLVSREHARIVIDDDGARCEDLGSRNGVKINGVTSRGTTRLKDGDRLRIGTQELVFCTVATVATSPTAKTTGFLRYCASCRLPYPQELSACPACGATEQVDEDVATGPRGSASPSTWGLQMLVEVMDKSLRVDRPADAVRAVQRAKTQLEEQLAAGGPIDGDQFHVLAAATLRVSIASSEPAWACWIAHVYGQLKIAPSDAVLALFSGVAAAHPRELGPSLADLLATLREALSEKNTDLSRTQTDARRVAIARLEPLIKISAHAPEADEAFPNEDTNPAIS